MANVQAGEGVKLRERKNVPKVALVTYIFSVLSPLGDLTVFLDPSSVDVFLFFR